MTPQVATLLGMITDFITSPFAWLGFIAFVVSKRPKAARYRKLLMWVFWIGCGIAALTSISYAIRSMAR